MNPHVTLWTGWHIADLPPLAGVFSVAPKTPAVGGGVSAVAVGSHRGVARGGPLLAGQATGGRLHCPIVVLALCGSNLTSNFCT